MEPSPVDTVKTKKPCTSDNYNALIQLAHRVMKPVPTRNGQGQRQPLASKVRSAENRIFRTLDGLKNRVALHLPECESCQQARAKLITKWAELNSFLANRGISTERSVSFEQWRDELQEREYQRLKTRVTELVKTQETEEKVSEHLGKYEAIYAQVWSPNPRRG